MFYINALIHIAHVDSLAGYLAWIQGENCGQLYQALVSVFISSYLIFFNTSVVIEYKNPRVSAVFLALKTKKKHTTVIKNAKIRQSFSVIFP